jgi:hypothetical protein
MLNMYAAHASVAAVSGLGVDNPPQCVNFTSGNGKNELYSPNYPNKYHNFTDCTRIIEGNNIFIAIFER